MDEYRNLQRTREGQARISKQNKTTNILQILQLLSPTEIYSPEQANT